MSIKENLEYIHNSIEEIALKNNRDISSIKLLAVSKTKPIELLQEAYNEGQRLFGENRVSEAEIKVPLLPKDAEFHLIGHLQSNKVKKACKYFKCIQSVDSLKIAKKIDKTCYEFNKVMDVYLDINIANDKNKTGFIVNDSFFTIFEELKELKNINILGLMCIGAHVEDRDEISNSFKDLRMLLNTLKSKYPDFNGDKLSMGMSSDYFEAIKEGSTMVRIGSSIFGSRL
ncbi:YggS family pyridoxal phosphate-dependent enzyme [Thiospirochaeta perfilievii]|uniref:Pyridoxal phosphate homeostasis protein n=1 Tax=Thiospirochaeta perfilievii TaxID=252967 RepID=A0A5C1QCE6_9SPIO|nr:YggS family pyridoxal phosphate-dependent enzyme [Thiospirochaeta perfilievii]QEN05785.1 YggS family pyridoxal phosphate-dependent enzyme [Thiospirochaeta perfilievii]